MQISSRDRVSVYRDVTDTVAFLVSDKLRLTS
jgi:hypothetical protein